MGNFCLEVGGEPFELDPDRPRDRRSPVVEGVAHTDCVVVTARAGHERRPTDEPLSCRDRAAAQMVNPGFRSMLDKSHKTSGVEPRQLGQGFGFLRRTLHGFSNALTRSRSFRCGLFMSRLKEGICIFRLY